MSLPPPLTLPSPPPAMPNLPPLLPLPPPPPPPAMPNLPLPPPPPVRVEVTTKKSPWRQLWKTLASALTPMTTITIIIFLVLKFSKHSPSIKLSGPFSITLGPEPETETETEPKPKPNSIPSIIDPIPCPILCLEPIPCPGSFPIDCESLGCGCHCHCHCDYPYSL